MTDESTPNLDEESVDQDVKQAEEAAAGPAEERDPGNGTPASTGEVE
ncbi:hypothetical protein [Calidifontibacter indicus]